MPPAHSSAGLYPLGRQYAIGDEATFRETDALSGAEHRICTQRVTRVDEEANRVEINDGKQVWNSMGNSFYWRSPPIGL